MIKLTKDDVGNKFNTSSDVAPISICVFSTGDEGVFLFEDVRSKSVLLTNIHGHSLKGGSDVLSRHDPRTWLADIPDLGDIKDGWIACDESDDWYWYDVEPKFNYANWVDCSNACLSSIELALFSMPALTGDQWKDSKISVAELKQWQLDNKG